MGGGSSGVVGRHVSMVWLSVDGVSSEQSRSSFILLEYLRGVPEIFFRNP